MNSSGTECGHVQWGSTTHCGETSCSNYINKHTTIYDQDMPHEYVFTFGAGHYDKNGQSLANKYVVIEAVNWDEARRLMHQQYGVKWAFQYETREQAGVFKYGLEEVPF